MKKAEVKSSHMQDINKEKEGKGVKAKTMKQAQTIELEDQDQPVGSVRGL